MSKRNKGKNAAANANGNGGKQTVVDGNAAGVAPEGEAATTTTETPSDDEVLAALEAADQNEPAGDTESPFTEVVDTSGTEDATEVVSETAEEVEVEIESADEDAVLAELEADEDDGATEKAKPKSKKKAAAPAAPVVTRQFCDVADHMDDSALKTALDGIAAKKVAEKANNVIQAITTGKKLSGFTQLAVKMLTEQGHVTSKDLVEAYQKDGKTQGTARAQAQQQTALFKALGIAAPAADDAKKLVACDNGLVKELAVLAAA